MVSLARLSEMRPVVAGTTTEITANISRNLFCLACGQPVPLLVAALGYHLHVTEIETVPPIVRGRVGFGGLAQTARKSST